MNDTLSHKEKDTSASRNDRPPRHATTWLVILCLLAGCPDSPPAPPSYPPSGQEFWSPEAIAASDCCIIVANTAHTLHQGVSDYGPGSVTVLDRASHQVLVQIPTSQANPRALMVREPLVFVLNSGQTQLGKTGLMEAVTDGGIDILDFAAGPPRQVLANIPLPIAGSAAESPGRGAPNSMVIGPDGRFAYLGSGTRADLFKVDLEQRKVLRGPANPLTIFPTPPAENGLTLVRPWGAGLAVIDFNGEVLCLSEDWTGDLGQRQCGSIKAQQHLLAGPLDVARLHEHQALVLMTLANGLFFVDTAQDPFALETNLVGTGSAPNRLVIHQGYAYVVNSLSNNIQRLDLSSQRSDLPFAVLPLASNPIDMVITEEAEGGLAWVTLFNAHQVALITLSTGEVVEMLGQLQANDGGAALQSDRTVSPSEAGPPDGGAPTDSAPVLPIVGVSSVVKVEYGSGAGFGQGALPQIIQDGPQGGGDLTSSTDVLALGVKGEIILDFGAYDMVDGPGPDFIVYENAFLLTPFQSFAEPAIVGLSTQGTAPEDFLEFPCDLSQSAGNPATQTWPFPGCAGVQPVRANVKTNSISPTDPVAAGGDAFDLATLGLQRARYLRLRDAGLSKMGKDNKGFDLDAVVLIHYLPR